MVPLVLGLGQQDQFCDRGQVVQGLLLVRMLRWQELRVRQHCHRVEQPVPGNRHNQVVHHRSAGAFLTDSASNKATSAATGAKYSFKATGDSAYTIQNALGGFLGVASTTTATHVWGTVPTISTRVGQQWWIIPSKDGATFRLLNRYSGLVLALSGTQGRLAETTPARSWDSNGSGVVCDCKAAEQALVFTVA
jgi:hypothetical protein